MRNTDYITNRGCNIDDICIFEVLRKDFVIGNYEKRNGHVDRIRGSVSMVVTAVIRKDYYGIIFRQGRHDFFNEAKGMICGFIVFFGSPTDFVADAVRGFKIEECKIRFIF